MKPVPALVPLSWIYECGVVVRNLFFDREIFHAEHVGVPVISVGNISAGGTGKTPVVESIARTLTERGILAGIISRGFKRSTRGLVEVSDGKSLKVTTQESGDEPHQLAIRLPHTVVVVDEQRVRGARYAVNNLGVQAIILDDGFQHRAIHRDLDIVVIDASRSPFSMRMLPAGYRRDTYSSLKRADVILLTKVKQTTTVDRLEERIRKFSDAKIFTSTFSVAAFRRAKTKFSVNLESVKGKKAVAFCGIGQPESFRTSLEEIGVHVVSLMPFEDHHSYSRADLACVAAEQEKLSAEYIVTTEKDMARLSGSTSGDFLEKNPVFYVEMRTEIHHQKEWNALVLSTIKKKNGQ
jgi:tetraacyldisaccharide 4'-kinase